MAKRHAIVGMHTKHPDRTQKNKPAHSRGYRLLGKPAGTFNVDSAKLGKRIDCGLTQYMRPARTVHDTVNRCQRRSPVCPGPDIADAESVAGPTRIAPYGTDNATLALQVPAKRAADKTRGAGDGDASRSNHINLYPRLPLIAALVPRTQQDAPRLFS